MQALYEADEVGRHITVTQLATLCGVRLNTISGHVTELRERSGYIRECGNMRGWLELTPAGRAYARSLQVRSEGIVFRGVIAAGPATRIEEINDMLTLPQFDPALHFALTVRGTSMVGFGIFDGDLAIFRKVDRWQEIPDRKIVAARVPEGMGADTDDWIDQLDAQMRLFNEADVPPLDYVTLKQFTARFRSYFRDGVELQGTTSMLRGSNGVFRPRAIEIDGVLVQSIRNYG